MEIRCARHKAGLGEASGHCFRGLAATRTRWQIELTFKRFKSLAQLGCLPKYDDDSAKVWLYGKLLAALLVEKLIHHASAISPRGTKWDPDRPRSAWRDFKSVWNQVKRAIKPLIPVSQTLADWPALSTELAENPRKRRSQIVNFFGDDQ